MTDPIWLRRTHPAWCIIRHGHLDNPVNRTCESSGDGRGIPMSMSPASADDRDGIARLPVFSVDLEMEYREGSPHVVLSGEYDLSCLTLDEAEQVLRLLTERIAQGRATGGEDR